MQDNLYSFILPHNLPKKSVLILHGYAEHIGRYEKLAKRLHDEGCQVVGFDWRGHGRSEGKKVWINSFDDYLDDLDTIVKQYFDNQKFILYAHSMGALVAAVWIIKRQPEYVEKVILSSGLFKLDDGVNPLLRKIAPFLSKFFPYVKSPKLDSSAISRVATEVEKYNTDPLNYRKGTFARTGYEIMKAMNFVADNSQKISLPTLLLQGTADKLTNQEGSKNLFANISSKDKYLKLFDGGYHELLNDECEEEYIDTVARYVLEGEVTV